MTALGELPEGMKECPHCNGYGSSLHENADRCTHCDGTGLVPAEDDDEEPGSWQRS